MAKTPKSKSRKSAPIRTEAPPAAPAVETSPEVLAWLTPEARRATLDWNPSVGDLSALAARRPEQFPSINGELPWIALTSADAE